MKISSIALGGMEEAERKLENTAKRVASFGSGGDTVDLSSEMVSLMEARTDFDANAKVAKTADEIERSTINLLG